MNMCSLESFAVVAKTKNFTKAAEQLFLSQPALSRVVSSLEHELGVKLLERNTRNAELNAAGQLCLQHIHTILDAYEALRRDMERTRRSIVGELRVGYNAVVGQPEFFIRALCELSRSHSGVSVDIRRAYSPRLLEGVREGTLDCCLISDEYIDDDSGLEIAPLHEMNLCALVPDTHPLAAQEEIPLAALTGESLVALARERAPRYYDTVFRAFSDAGIEVRVSETVDEIEDVILRVRMGRGVALLTSWDRSFSYSGAKAVRLAQVPPRATRVLAWSRDTKNPCIEAFRMILEHAANEAFGEG